jgi:CRP/FNR family transcriptional regulator
MTSIDLLKNSYLGRSLDENELKAIASIALIRSLVKGELLFIEGDAATGFYILLDGQVRLYKSSPDGKEYTLHQIRSGQIFAEVAIFHGHKFPANCMAVNNSTVAFFPEREFIRLLEKSPQIALKIIGSMAAFLRDFNNQLEQLSLKEVPARLADYILAESIRTASGTIQLDTTKTELASRLGTISETLSRNLRKFMDAGIIEVEHKKIKILDPARLTSIAEGEKI